MALINIDIDNTINDFLDKFVMYFNGMQLSNKQITREDFIHYNISESTGISNPILDALFFRNNHFHSTFLPLPNSIETITALKDNGNCIRFVTSIHYDVIQSRLDFIKEFFPFIDVNKQLIVTNDKKVICADVVIDDKESHITGGNINPNCKFIVFDQPWNRKPVYKDDVRRAYDWNDVADILKEWRVL